MMMSYFVVHKPPGLMIVSIGLSWWYDNDINLWLINPRFNGFMRILLLWLFYFVVGKQLGLMAL